MLQTKTSNYLEGISKKPPLLTKLVKLPLVSKALIASVLLGVGGMLLAPKQEAPVVTGQQITTEQNSLIDMFLKGGPLMWPILSASIIGLTAVISRMRALHNMNHTDPNILRRALIERLSNNEIDAAISLCLRSNSTIAKIYQAGISRFGKDSLSNTKEYLEKKFFDEMQLEEKRYSGIIGSGSSSTTLLGYIGTLSGLQYIFSQALSQSTHMQGLDKALITSIFGGSAAVLFLIAQQITNSKSRALEGQIMIAIDEFIFDISQLPQYKEK